MILSRTADPEKLKQLNTRLTRLISLAASSQPSTLFFHQDCDELEPAHIQLGGSIIDLFGGEGHYVCPVVPAWEFETWLLQWPCVLGGFREKWRTPDEYEGKDLGRIKNSKETLQSALIPKNLSRAKRQSFRTYEEADSPEIIKVVADKNLLTSPRATSRSYDSFRERLAGCPTCETSSRGARRGS
jgi:hypothetical protein